VSIRGKKTLVNKDQLTKERRSWNMSRIRGKNTSPEKRVRSLLHRLGYRFRLHVRIALPAWNAPRPSDGRGIKGEGLRESGERAGVRCRKVFFVRPDIVLPKHKTVIFVHGCFWHQHRGCKNCTTPTHRRAWWLKKLEGNAARDKLHQHALRKLGWRIIVVWECEIEKVYSLERIRERFLIALSGKRNRG
jgi:DNA mismatch endonuclease (patch repair protein)